MNCHSLVVAVAVVVVVVHVEHNLMVEGKVIEWGLKVFHKLGNCKNIYG